MLEEKKLVSVIVPIYNVDKYVAKCIESICGQTYQNLEIILVDDGSTDNSGEICDAFAKKDNRVRVIHKKNAGVSAARNSGIDACTGDYICFVDGDDYVMDDYVEYLLKMIQETQTDIALSTDLYSNFDSKQSTDKQVKICSSEQATEMILCYKIPIGVYNKIFSRELLNKGVRFEESLCIGEGFNFNTAAFQRANRIAIGHRKIYFYRKDNTNSVTTKFNATKWENGLYAIQLIKKNLILQSDNIKKAWEFAWWRTNTDVYDLLVLANAEKTYPEMYNNCCKVMKEYKFSCFYATTSSMQRARAIILWICPKLIPQAMIRRRKKYNVDVTN